MFLSGDQISYQDQTIKLSKSVKLFAENIIHSFNTTDSFGRINRNEAKSLDHFFSFSFFNYELDDKLPWAGHIHYEEFLGKPYLSFKEIDSLINIDDFIISLGITKKEFYDKYLHSTTRSQVSYLDRETTAKAIEGELYKTLIYSTVFKRFYKGVIKNLLDISSDDNKHQTKGHIREMTEIIKNSNSLLDFNTKFVQYVGNYEIGMTDNFEQFDTQHGDFYNLLIGWLDNYDTYKTSYNHAIDGSSFKVLKDGDIPFFCINTQTKKRKDIYYDQTTNEIIMDGDERIKYSTKEDLLKQLKEHEFILIPKALMLSYQRLLLGDIVLPQKGSEYVFLLNKFQKALEDNNIENYINQITIMEFDLFKELSNVENIKIPLDLARVLGLEYNQDSLSREKYVQVRGQDFYTHYINKEVESKELLSTIGKNKDDIQTLMEKLNFIGSYEYKKLNLNNVDVVERIKSYKELNGTVLPELIQERENISKNIRNLKKSFYTELLQTILDSMYISKINKNSYRPYVLRLYAIDPELINKLVNNTKITTFDVENNKYIT